MTEVHLHIHFHGESDRAGLEFARQTAQDWLGRIKTLQAEIDSILGRQPEPATDAPAAQEAGTIPNEPNCSAVVEEAGEADRARRDEALAKLREIKARVESRVEGKKGRSSKRPTCVICGKPVSYGATACQKHIKAARKLREQEPEKKRRELLRAYDDETGPEEIEMDDGDPDPDEEIEAPDEEEDGNDEEVI